MELKNKIIAIDFDGTCVTHDYPNIGRDIGAERVLKKMIVAGAKLVLLTMRSGALLQDAVQWFNDRDIALFGVNENPTQKSWSDSPKIFAHLYIDDLAFGAPLIEKNNERGFICWKTIEEKLLPQQELF
jgi:hypothetical protein